MAGASGGGAGRPLVAPFLLLALAGACSAVLNSWGTAFAHQQGTRARGLQDLSSNQTITEVRLANKTGNAGRLEVLINGVWGTVCDDGFGIVQASAVCRQLNLSNRGTVKEGHGDASFGSGTSPILVSELACPEGARSLQGCTWVNGSSCTHSEDVGINCTDVCAPFPLAVKAACGASLTVGLYARLGQDEDAGLCANGATRAGDWCLAQRNLTNRQDELRLYSNLDPETGYRSAQYYFYGVEASGLDGGLWGARADDPRAKWLNPATGMPCNATAARADCLPLLERNVTREYCPSSVDGLAEKLYCSGGIPILDMRLAAGTSSTSGRLEVLVGEDWGTVVGPVGPAVARVICKDLGLAGGRGLPSGSVGQEGVLPALLANLDCISTESSLADCDFETVAPGVNTFGQSTVGVVCDIPNGTITDVRLQGGSDQSSGRLEVKLSSSDIWGTVCDAGLDRREADVACQHLGLGSNFVAKAVPGAYFGPGTRSVLVQLQCTGVEKSLADCFYTIAPNCTHAQDAGVICAPVTGTVNNARLTNATSPGGMAGRLEIQIGQYWGTVCNDAFGASSAATVCMHLGLGTRGRTYIVPSTNDSLPVLAESFECAEGASLANCTYQADHNCQHSEDIGLACETGPISAVRLSPNDTQGRLEVLVDGTWGAVCENGLSGAAASVACRQMGLGSNGRAYSGGSETSGLPSLPVLVTKLACVGSEDALQDCTVNLDASTCSNFEELQCQPTTQEGQPGQQPQSTASSSSSAGIIAGVVTGVMVAAVAAGFLTFYFVRRRSRQRQTLAADAEQAAHKLQPGSAPPAPVLGGTGPGARLMAGGTKAVVVPAADDVLTTYPTRPPGMAPESLASFLSGGESTSPSLLSSLSSGPTSSVAKDALLAYITSLRSQAQSTSPHSGEASMSSQPCSSGIIDVHPWEVKFEELTFLDAVGEGSFGRVYRAKWHESIVACKVLLAGGGVPATADEAQRSLALSARTMAKLEEEAGLLASLRHPCIVSFYGLCRDPPCILSEFCARGSLYDVLAAGRQSAAAAAQLTWHRRLSMLLDAALGMLHLHCRTPPIIHRDLKSPNLLVDKDWNAKVTDFNLSRVLDEARNTSSAAAMNPRWLAPELMRGGSATRASDVFAFGVVMWEMATWTLPWGAANPWQLVGQVLNGRRLEMPPHDQLPGPDTSGFAGFDAYLELMRLCWAQDETERPTFEEVVPQLRELQAAAAPGGD